MTRGVKFLHDDLQPYYFVHLNSLSPESDRLELWSLPVVELIGGICSGGYAK